MILLNFTVHAPEGDPGIKSGDLLSVRQIAANRVSDVMREHLESLPGESFYKRVADSIGRVDKAKSSEVSIAERGYALQLFGGTVKAGKGISSKTGKRTKFLSIPANKGIKEMPDAYDNLSFIKLKGGKGALVRLKKDKSFTPMFWLVKQATIKPHPEVMPRQESIDKAASQGALSAINQLDFYKL
ncbi:MAG: hypothetical protein R3Y56_07735 [Akkermansia sp.]